MGAKANLANAAEVFGMGADSVVISHYVGGIDGGRTLDVSGYTEAEIKAGHIVIRSTSDETLYKPMPVSGGEYSSLPSGYEYVGVVVSTVLASQPLVGIMNAGTVNDAASPYPISAQLKTDLKSAVPTLIFIHA